MKRPETVARRMSEFAAELEQWRTTETAEFDGVCARTRDALGPLGDIVRATFELKSELAHWPGEYWET